MGIKIDKEETLEELRDLVKKALGFAISMNYLTDKTISYFISKAAGEEKALGKLVEVEKEEPVEEDNEEVETRETKEENLEKETEEKAEKAKEESNEDLNKENTKEEK